MRKILIFLLLLPSLLIAEVSYDEKLDYIYSIRLNDINKAKNLLVTLEAEYPRFSETQKARYLNLRAHSELIRGQYKNAMHYIKQVLKETDNINYRYRARSLRTVIFSKTGSYQKSFIEMYDLLDGLDKLDDVQLKQDILQNALVEHVQANILDKSQDLVRRNLAFSRKFKDNDGFCNAFYESSLVEKHLNNFEQSQFELDKALPYCEKAQSKLQLLAIKVQRALLEKEKGNLNESKKALEAIYPELVTFSWQLMLMDVQIEMADLYLQLNELAKVEPLVLAAYEFSQNNKDLRKLKKSSMVLARFYRLKDDFEKSNFYSQQYQSAAIELSNQLEKRRIGYYQAMNIRKQQQSIRKVVLQQ